MTKVRCQKENLKFPALCLNLSLLNQNKTQKSFGPKCGKIQISLLLPGFEHSIQRVLGMSDLYSCMKFEIRRLGFTTCTYFESNLNYINLGFPSFHRIPSPEGGEKRNFLLMLAGMQKPPLVFEITSCSNNLPRQIWFPSFHKLPFFRKKRCDILRLKNLYFFLQSLKRRTL